MAIAGFELAGTYYAHTSNLDIPSLFWATLALTSLMKAVEQQNAVHLRSTAWLIAFAIATKDQAYALFALAVPYAIAALCIDAYHTKTLRPVLREALRFVFQTVALVLFLDGAVFNPSGFAARLRFLTGPASQDFAAYSRDWAGRFAAFSDALAFLPHHYPALIAPLFVIGIPIAFASRRGMARAAGLIPAMAMVSFTLTFNCVARRVEERFMLAQMQLLAVYAGGAIAACLAAVRARPWLRALSVAYAAVALALAVRMSASVVATMLGDARYDAERFLNEHTRPGDTIETYGLNVYLPRFPEHAHVERVGPSAAASRNPMPNIIEKEAPLEDVMARKPRFVVVGSGFAWRFLEDSRATIEGRMTPQSQRAARSDNGATLYMRALFSDKTEYRVAHIARYAGSALLPPRPLHASLATDVWIFEKKPDR